MSANNDQSGPHHPPVVPDSPAHRVDVMRAATLPNGDIISESGEIIRRGGYPTSFAKMLALGLSLHQALVDNIKPEDFTDEH